MRRHAADALAAARHSTTALVAAAAGMLALAEYHLPDVAAARALLDEAAARLDALSDDQLAGRLDAALFVGWAEQCLARWDDVHRHYERALAVARATGQGYLLVPMTIGRAIAFTWQGKLAAAAELAEEAIEAAHLSGNEQSVAWALTLRCWVATLAGDLELALPTGEEALDTPGPVAHPLGRAGGLLPRRGAPGGRRPRGLRAAAAAQLPLVERAFQTRWYEILSRAELAAGRFSEAERHAAHAEAAARGLGLPARTSEALRARAAVLLAAGDAPAPPGPPEPRARRTAPATGWTRPARSCSPASARRRRAPPRGNRRAARRRETFPTPARAASTTRLRGSCAGSAAASPARAAAAAGPSGVGALTDREREVAALLAGGHTNRRIADQLHLSTKTVETHVANIFGKLGVRSRAAVAATMAGRWLTAR